MKPQQLNPPAESSTHRPPFKASSRHHPQPLNAHSLRFGRFEFSTFRRFDVSTFGRLDVWTFQTIPSAKKYKQTHFQLSQPSINDSAQIKPIPEPFLTHSHPLRADNRSNDNAPTTKPGLPINKRQGMSTPIHGPQRRRRKPPPIPAARRVRPPGTPPRRTASTERA